MKAVRVIQQNKTAVARYAKFTPAKKDEIKDRKRKAYAELSEEAKRVKLDKKEAYYKSKPAEWQENRCVALCPLEMAARTEPAVPNTIELQKKLNRRGSLRERQHTNRVKHSSRTGSTNISIALFPLCLASLRARQGSIFIQQRPPDNRPYLA